MTEIKMNQADMRMFFRDFNAFRHKFFYNQKDDEPLHPKRWDALIQCFYPHGQKYWDIHKAVETFRTMDKVYHYGSTCDVENTNLLEQVTEKFLGQYVAIDGMDELFKESYFYFEWMMHLEYKEQQHDYSYYRDHYLHQVRNLYEMFRLLDHDNLWIRCMNIYRQKGNRVAISMENSIREQRCNLCQEKIKCLEEIPNTKFEEWNYHYIIFATAIVSALVHDIGYPIVYMKRNMDRLQGFLPMSHLFMGLEDSMPRIKSLLNDSLLFTTVHSSEIIKRLEGNDHGAYSAIILLYQYYDNGKIFSLEPVKRMVVELSALVIYNHTLKYSFQDKKKYDRYQNVFVDNPISYLFRLCDDMQEWERVYFQISDRSTFFICDKCKTPMIRKTNRQHTYGSKGKVSEYCCFCGRKGLNSIWFPYRRMINVAPFTDLEIQCIGKGNVRESEKWLLNLVCDKKALLQLAKYNDTFALQRLRGVRELRAMVKGQAGFPCVCVKAFISNNPIAIKAQILKEFVAKYGRAIFQEFAEMKKNEEGFRDIYAKNWSSNRLGIILRQLKENIKIEEWSQDIYCTLEKNISKSEETDVSDPNSEGTEKLMKESIAFYLYLILVGSIICKDELSFETEELGEYQRRLFEYCTGLAREVASVWDIYDTNTVDLIGDCFASMYCDSSTEEFPDVKSYRYQVAYPLRKDICDVVQGYTDERDYLEVCKLRKRKKSTGENIFDFYSDYFLYFMMDCCVEGSI